MAGIEVPTEGRQTEETNSDILLGVDGNAFSVMGVTRHALQRAGATKGYREAFQKDAMSGNYEHLLAVAMAYLDADPRDPDDE